MERLASVALAEGPGETVERALEIARETLNMDIAYLTEFSAGRQLFAKLAGDADSFHIAAGWSIPLEESYCQRMVSGEVPNVIPDVPANPVVSDLELTRHGQIGSYVGVPMQASDGSVHGTLCCLSHATDPAVAERDVQFMHVLARLVCDELERADLRQQADQMKDDFLALVSHDLRTPLTSIIGYAGLVAQDEAAGLSKEARHGIEVIDRNARRLERLVAQLLFVAQAQADRMPPPEFTEAEMESLVEEAVEAARPSAQTKGVELALDAEPAPAVSVDPDQLGQLLDNLTSNAIKFTPEGGRVEVRLRSGERGAVIQVADSGPGIPADEQAQLFDRFFRASHAHAEGAPGVGLGLWIAKTITDLHGGSLSLESEPGVGTTFTVELPAA